jgi:HK97 family phage major capsid protein/HK97 family phage prohead protease
MGKIKEIPKRQLRAFENIAVRTVSETEDNKTLEFSFSSETPYKRWYGFEIISHEKGAMNMERLNAAAPLLFNHDWDQPIGVIEKAWVGDDKRGYVQVKFSRNTKAQEVLQDINDGILKGVSFGYMIEEMKLTKASDSGDDEYTVTKSFPYEVSIVTIPADYSVGIGRSAEDEKGEKIAVIHPEPVSAPITEPTPQPTNIPAARSASEGGKMDNQAAAAEKLRIQTITKMGEKFKKPELAAKLINEDKTIDQAREIFLDEIGEKQTPVTGNEAVVGMSDKEVRQYSVLRAIRAMLDPNNKTYQEEAAFEREISMAAAKKSGKDARGFIIPVDVLRSPLFVQQRDLTAGTSTAGGNLVATNLLSGSFIDILSKKAVLMRAGAQVLNGLVGNIAIPRQTSGASAYWIGEGSAPTESAQAFDQVTMGPKTVGAFVDYSRKLMLQSSIDVEAFVRMDLARILALEIDRVGLYGSGSSNQPLGIKDTSGINTVDFAAATPTFAEVVQLESEVAADDADVAGMKYLVNASMRGALKTAQKASNTAQFIWEPGDTVNGYEALVSNQLASGDVIFGNFSDLIMGFWSGLDLLADPYTGSKEGNIRIVAHQDVDMAVRHAESFCRGNNTL